MNFTSLPWFIKKEIIDLVIEEAPQYCQISREWLQQVAEQRGELIFNIEAPATWSLTPFTPYIKNACFQRDTNIDWDIVYSYKNLKRVELEFDYGVTENYIDFNERLLLLPPLEYIFIQTPKRKYLDFSHVLKRNQEHLSELFLAMWYIDWFPLNTIFSKLKALRLVMIRGSQKVQELVKNMPVLESLDLSCELDFNSDKMPRITDLTLSGRNFDTAAKLELSLFPNMKKLCFDKLELTNKEPHINSIEELSIQGHDKYLDCLKSVEFKKLRTLNLDFYSSKDQADLFNLFQFLATITSLVTLRLDVDVGQELSFNIPAGSYSITDLTLKGPFALDSDFLNRLSSQFKLKELELEGCFLKDPSQKTVPFTHLRRLDIIQNQKRLGQFGKYFSKKNYPHLIVILIDEDEECNQQSLFMI